jgi:hypothetical protein
MITVPVEFRQDIWLVDGALCYGDAYKAFTVARQNYRRRLMARKGRRSAEYQTT